MRILWVGPYRDSTGYSKASTDYVLALDKADVNVVCRPLKLNDVQAELPTRLLELENRAGGQFDAVIMHALPTMAAYNRRAGKNICLFAAETTHFRRSGWADRLNQMDEVWAPNLASLLACHDSGVTVPIQVVPHACDTDTLFRPREPLLPRSGKFRFYFIGELTRRKNVSALLRAFHMEFRPSEPVELVIKTSISGLSPQESKGRVEEYCREIRRCLRLGPNFAEEVILTDRLSEEDILRLHLSCDCYVGPSYGEAWNIPAATAMALGRFPLVTGWGGPTEYVEDGQNGLLISYRMESVFGADGQPELYRANELWAAVDVSNLAWNMRWAYEHADRKREDWAGSGRKRALGFSHAKVGALMRQLLDGHTLAATPGGGSC